MDKAHKTKDLIKLLPFEKSFQEELATKYDTMDESEHYVVDQILWTTYDSLFEMQVQTNLQIAMEEIKDGKRKMEGDLYPDVLKQTQQSFDQYLMSIKDDSDLSVTKEELNKIIKSEGNAQN